MLPDLTIFHAVKVTLQPYRYDYLISGHEHHSLELIFIDDKGNEIALKVKAFNTETAIAVSHNPLKVVEITR